MGGLNKRIVLSHRLEVQVHSVDRIGSFEGSEGESVPASPHFWWFAGNLWLSLACR